MLMLLLVGHGALAADLRFVVVGDTQAHDGAGVNEGVVAQLVEDMNTLSPDMAFFVGDLTNGAGDVPGQVAAWQDWLAVTAGLDCPRYPMTGNHDLYAGPGAKEAFAEVFGAMVPVETSPDDAVALSWYLDVGDVRLVSVLSDDDWGTNVTPDMGWLEPVLREGASRAHVFTFTHHPVSWSAYDTAMEGTQGDFWQSLLVYDVAALFTGHWHLYQPGQLGGGAMAPGRSGSASTWEVIAGTGGGYQGYEPVRPSNLGYGFVLVEVDGERVEAAFYRDEDGDGHYDDEVDRFVIRGDEGKPRGLVAWYPLDDDAADHAPLDVGHGIDAAPLGGAALVDDPARGRVLALDGEGSALEAASIRSYQHSIKGDLTLSVFARADRLGAGEWDNALVVYATNDEYTEDEETNYAYWLSVRADGRLVAFWEWGEGVNVTLTSTAPAPTDGGWHHYALVRDVAAQQVRFYVDGAPLGSPVGFTRLPSGASRGLLYVGSDTVDVDGSYWAGAVDDVCVFDVPLTDAEVASVFADGGCAAWADGGDAVDTGRAPRGPGDDDGKGCGCDALVGAGGAWWAAAVVAGWLRRGRRPTTYRTT
jgi:hypothetical protein